MNDGKITAYLPVGKYIFKFDEPKLDWTISDEKKEILNKSCRLAKTVTEKNEVFYAWFSEDIPINDGPFRFKGLAGLILEVYNKNETIHIIATEIANIQEPI